MTPATAAKVKYDAWGRHRHNHRLCMGWLDHQWHDPKNGRRGGFDDSDQRGLPTICQPQFINFLPHLDDWFMTNPARIIARTIT